jgi:4-hydroxy-tetrahydrodipicolinate synthase
MLGYQGSVFNGGSYSSRLFIFPEARVLIRRKDMSIFKGAGVAIVTPMKENLDVNYDKLEELINFHVDNGTDAIIIAGTTGESSTLTMEEHRQVIRAAVEFTKHRIPVVAGTGSNCTRTAIQLTKEAEEDGADAALIVTPYYNKATQAGLVSHYSQIADETKLPIILYNVPGRTGCNLQPETVATLVKTKENIVGLKEATGNMAQASETMRQCDGKLELYSGEIGLVVPLLSIGGIGVISVISNVAPRQTHDMLQAFFDGDVEKAAAMQLRSLPLVNALFSEVNPIPVKKALNLMGMNVGSLRSPLCEMGAEHAAQLEQAMKDFGIL